MSHFLKLVSKYNGLLNEEDQIDPSALPEDTENVPTDSSEPAEPQQISPDVESAIPTIQPKDLQLFLNSLQSFFSSETYKGSDKEDILNALVDKDDMAKLPDTLKNLSTVLNPETSLDPEKSLETIKSADDIQ